jgi:hypothetical protein
VTRPIIWRCALQLIPTLLIFANHPGSSPFINICFEAAGAPRPLKINQNPGIEPCSHRSLPITTSGHRFLERYIYYDLVPEIYHGRYFGIHEQRIYSKLKIWQLQFITMEKSTTMIFQAQSLSLILTIFSPPSMRSMAILCSYQLHPMILTIP